MHKICAKLYLFLQCAIYAQDLRKIVLISSMHNICARFAQDYTYFSNAQYMCKICTRLNFFPQCAIYVQDLHKILSQCTIYVQDLHKIVLLSPMRNICARFAQDYTSFSQCTIYAQDLRKIVVIYPMRNICARFVQDGTYFLNVHYMHKICARLYLFL